MGAPQEPLRGSDMGRVLKTFRCWPGPISVTVMTLTTAGVVAWQWWAVPDDPLWFRFFVLVLMLLLCAALALPGVLERHRVCEHGLVLGYGPTRRARYVVPWTSVDPRVRILVRAQLISRHDGVPQVSPHYRIGTGPLAYRALAVKGLDTATDAGTWLHIPGLLETPNTIIRDSGRRESRYAWWILGTPRPERLAQAIEEAMVADGHPKARGMAARAVAETIVVPWTRGPNPLRSRQR